MAALARQRVVVLALYHQMDVVGGVHRNDRNIVELTINPHETY